jgi:hypothetical protein
MDIHREAATNYVLANFPGAAAWDAGGRVDGNWDDAVKLRMHLMLYIISLHREVMLLKTSDFH